jgi:adenylosuccinate synthase
LPAYIIVDLGFGDAGKGLLTDYLVRYTGAPLVVRYNGGAQAGHNVVTPDWRHHTFAQFGSGTFNPGVKTYLSQYVVIHPAALLAEGDLLQTKGVQDVFARLRLSDRALVITPYHQAANRIREIVRGANRHGSCGVGVGEAVEDTHTFPEDRVLAGDLSNPKTLRRKLHRIREQKRDQLASFCVAAPPCSRLASECRAFERDDIIDAWMTSIARISELGLVVSDEVLERWLHEMDTVIFEGAQGVLLDAEAGFHPYTTWSQCTTKNAFELLAELAPDVKASRVGVMRSYAVRHGPGPLPTETDYINTAVSEHNETGEWQGAMRYGWFDSVLAHYALEVNGGVDTVMLTHLDLPSRLGTWKVCIGYKDNGAFDSLPVECNISAGVMRSFHAPQKLSLEQRAQLTQALFNVEPILETCMRDERGIIQRVESLIGQSIGMISHGPIALDVQRLDSSPL